MLLTGRSLRQARNLTTPCSTNYANDAASSTALGGGLAPQYADMRLNLKNRRKNRRRRHRNRPTAASVGSSGRRAPHRRPGAALATGPDPAGSRSTSLRRPRHRLAPASISGASACAAAPPKLDRLGRSTRELLDLIERISKAGAAFRSIGDPLWDTSSSQGRLLSTLLAAIAEFERDLIKERTGEGRKRAMANGVKFGRKPKLSEYQRKEAIKRRAAGETLAEIAKSYAVDISMISRLS